MWRIVELVLAISNLDFARRSAKLSLEHAKGSANGAISFSYGPPERWFLSENADQDLEVDRWGGESDKTRFITSSDRHTDFNDVESVLELGSRFRLILLVYLVLCLDRPTLWLHLEAHQVHLACAAKAERTRRA